MPTLHERYAEVLRWITGSTAAELPAPSTLAFRPFFVLSLVLFSAFVAARWYHRVDLVLRSAALSLATSVAVDVLLVVAHRHGGPEPFAFGGNVINGFALVLVSAGVILSAHHTPPSIRVEPQRERSRRFALTLLLALGIGLTITLSVLLFASEQLSSLRDYAVLGGLGPGIVLLIPTVQALLFAFVLVGRAASRLARWFDPRQERDPFGANPPSVAFLVPAHNEEQTITESLLSIDRASVGYPRRPRVYVVNNASTDDTEGAARAAFARCEHVDGEVLDCPTPGKSHALNYGLQRITEQILIRVDSDSLLADDVLPRVMRHFRDPAVGGVGGLALPLPEQAHTVMSRVRAIEVYHNVGLVRVAQGSVDGVMVLPGQLSAYRREIVEDLGGFAEGINGEDTDLTVRAGRAGWRIVMDPSVRLYSEAPPNIPHLREQRLRWSRSLVHVYKRNIPALWQGQGIRGLWLLPMGLISSVRRAGVPLMIIYALASMAVAPGTLFVREGVAVLAVLIGPPSILAVVAVVAYARFDLLPYLPGYFALRLFRAYVSLEALLTMRHRSLPAAEAVEQPRLAPPAARPTLQPAVQPLALPRRRRLTPLTALSGAAFAAVFISGISFDASRESEAGAPGPAITLARASAAEPLFAGAAAPRPAPTLAWGEEPELRDVAASMGKVEVEPGDSLEQIARRHGSTVETLARYNRIEDPARIQAGQWLLVPRTAAVAGR